MKKLTRPVPPNRNKTEERHYIDVDAVMFRYYRYDDEDNEAEVSPDKKNDYDYIYTECREPSLQDLIALVPEGVSLDQVHIDMDLEHSGYYEILNGMRMYWTTPYDYEAEMAKYTKEMAAYEKQEREYNERHGKKQ